MKDFTYNIVRLTIIISLSANLYEVIDEVEAPGQQTKNEWIFVGLVVFGTATSDTSFLFLFLECLSNSRSCSLDF